MRINNNVGALNTYSKLTATNSAKDKSLEKLSSGLRINKAADDAAGLAISEKMRAQIRGLNQANRNAQDGVSLIQTAEGGLSETHSMLQRMRELSVQASNGTLTTEDKANIQTEIDELITEIGKVSKNTKFNGKALLEGNYGVAVSASAATTILASQVSVSLDGAKTGETFTITNVTSGIQLKDSSNNVQIIGFESGTTGGSDLDAGTTFNFDSLGVEITFEKQLKVNDISGDAIKTTEAADGNGSIQVGANAGDTMTISIGDMSAEALKVSKSDIDVTTVAGAKSAINALDSAINTVSSERAKLGAYQNRLEHTMNNLTTSSENLTSAESRIRDVDMAEEMMNFTKNNILSQAATSMLAQANQSGQNVLQLLR